MAKLIKLLILVSQSVFLQFVHLMGLGAFLIAAACGWFRLPSWIVPILAVAFGVGVDKLADVSDVTGLLEKAEKANERGGFMILVYAAICIVGYITGAYSRRNMALMQAKTAAAPPEKH